MIIWRVKRSSGMEHYMDRYQILMPDGVFWAWGPDKIICSPEYVGMDAKESKRLVELRDQNIDLFERIYP